MFYIPIIKIWWFFIFIIIFHIFSFSKLIIALHIPPLIPLSAKYYQENKESLQKMLPKDIKIFLKKERKKSGNMVVNGTKISQKLENENLLITEKNITEWEKIPFYKNQWLMKFLWSLRKQKFWNYILKEIRNYKFTSKIWF